MPIFPYLLKARYNKKITKIALGTTSEFKIKYLSEALEELKIKVQIFPFSVSSGVSEQPMTSSETKQGAINRATKALSLTPECDIGLGIEVGYDLNSENLYEMFCWSANCFPNKLRLIITIQHCH